ncbi:MAG: hypothetical protein ABI707_20105 [Ferruginibacter sp.]
MQVTYFDNWLLFTIIFGLFLTLTFIMMRQSRNFYTKDVVVRKFTMMELEVPATARELVNLIKGLYLLPPAQSKKSINALRAQLKLDFLFMPLAYGSIFLLNWKVAFKMQLQIGHYVFLAFAFLQLVAWICDIIENIYLLGKIEPEPKMTSDKNHKNYLRMEAVKWGISLTATVCAVSAVFYFWLTGNFSSGSFYYLLIMLGELVIFFMAVKVFSKARV